jgi:hypothetical protein
MKSTKATNLVTANCDAALVLQNEMRKNFAQHQFSRRHFLAQFMFDIYPFFGMVLSFFHQDGSELLTATAR